MRCVVLVITLTGEPQDDSPAIAQAGAILRSGGLVAFPTETVYGLGANALDPIAVERIFAAKGRPSHNPVIVHVFDVAQAKEITEDWPKIATTLAEHFWPGPLTLVLSKAPEVPSIVTAGGSTVAIRCPAHPVARTLLQAANVPIAAPSANRSGHLSPTTAAHVTADLGDRIDCLIDCGSVEHGIESTVLDCTVDPPQILRPGPITRDDFVKIGIRVASRTAAQSGSVRKSPGLLSRHYAPHCVLAVIEREELSEALRKNAGPPIALLYRSEDHVEIPDGITAVPMPGAPRPYAKKLYRALRELEDRHARILVLRVPRSSAWDAVADRLERASKSH